MSQGSGLGWTPEVIGDLTAGEAERYVERLGDRRQKESDEMKAASRRKS